MTTPKLPPLPFAVFDEFGQSCEDRVRDHFVAAIAAQGVPDGWLQFDYSNPPNEGVIWVAVSTPKTDCDVDDYGQTFVRYTGETERSVCLVTLSVAQDDQIEFEPVDRWNTGHVPAEGVVTHFAPVTMPRLPSESDPQAPQAQQWPFPGWEVPKAAVVQQEPVATLTMFDMRSQTGTVDLQGNWRELRVGTHLYTHPAQQAKPQPLSEKEADRMTERFYLNGRPVPAPYRLSLVRATERHHGIKE